MKKRIWLPVFLLAVTIVSLHAHAEKLRPAVDAFAPLADSEKTAIETRVLNNILRSELRGSRYRIFSTATTGVKTEQGLRRYSYTLIYDYSRNVTYNVVTDVTEGVPGKLVEVMKPSTQPPPSLEEYAEAKELAGGLGRVKSMAKAPSVKLQESFPVDSPPPCDIDRCVEIQVNDLQPGGNHTLLLLITVNLSKREITQVREPSSPTSR